MEALLYEKALIAATQWSEFRLAIRSFVKDFPDPIGNYSKSLFDGGWLDR